MLEVRHKRSLRWIDADDRRIVEENGNISRSLVSMDSRSSARPRFKERANTVCSFNWRYEKAARFNGNEQNGNWVIMHSRLRWILVQWASLFADFRVFPHCVDPRVYTVWLISTWILWSKNVRWLKTYELIDQRHDYFLTRTHSRIREILNRSFDTCSIIHYD